MPSMSGAIDLDLHVHYGFVWLHSSDLIPDDLGGTRAGQRNGICGAAQAGVLSMMTGLHTGTVPFRVSLTELEPPLDPGWEEVVEVDFEPEDTELVLATFNDFVQILLPCLGTYRARYCASGMDQAREQDTRLDGDDVTDRYLLALWPATPSGEKVVRQASQQAAYWAQVAQETPAPAIPTEAERTAAEQADRDERLKEEQLESERTEMLRWRGVEPTSEMRDIGPVIVNVAQRDFALAQRVASETDEVRRWIATWAARQICDRARDAALDWTPALDALTRGEPLPPPFDESRQLFGLLYPSTGLQTRVARSELVRSTPRQHIPIDPPAAAAATLSAAQDPNAAVAAITALEQAAAGMPDLADFYARARRQFSTDTR